jgi:Cof subfamily protein (haloacid dehalogenase superfamily)
MIKLIAIDLDGTLFNTKQEITKNSRNAVRNARDSGLAIAIVTGRGKAGALLALDMLGLDLPFICSAGSLTYKNKTERLFARTFEIDDELNRIVNFVRETNSGLIADTLDGNWWFGPDELGDRLDPMTAAYAWESKRTFQPEIDLKVPTLKLTLVADRDILKQAETSLCHKCPSLQHVYAGMRYLDLTAHGVNKGSALDILCGHLGIHPQEVAAIGDQMIDISMFNHAGLSIAMENASEDVKHAALWIAPNNDADGVAWAIDRIIAEK